MDWNHRLVEIEPGTLMFCEVFYSDVEGEPEAEGAPLGFTEAFICGDTVAEMLELTARLARATARPVLALADFPADARTL